MAQARQALARRLAQRPVGDHAEGSPSHSPTHAGPPLDVSPFWLSPFTRIPCLGGPSLWLPLLASRVRERAEQPRAERPQRPAELERPWRPSWTYGGGEALLVGEGPRLVQAALGHSFKCVGIKHGMTSFHGRMAASAGAVLAALGAVCGATHHQGKSHAG